MGGLLGLRKWPLRAVQWTQTVLSVPITGASMNRTRIRRTIPSTCRTWRPSLSPYDMDDTAFTLADILRVRALGTSPDKH
jgi:hypothetical protein